MLAAPAPLSPSRPLLAPALQEWVACCLALLSGRLLLVVRKGGIHERQGGGFALAHQRFALLPTREHQRSARLRPEFAALDPGLPPRPGTLEVAGWAEAAGVWQVRELPQLLALGNELAHTDEELAARFRYRGEPWLFVVALRVHRLAAVQCVPDLPRYAGCVSWVDLEPGIDPAGGRPVLASEDFAARLAGIARILGGPNAPGPGGGT